VGSSCGNDAVVQRGWTFYERVGKKTKQLSLYSPLHEGLKQIKIKDTNFLKTLVVWILFKAWINPPLT